MLLHTPIILARRFATLDILSKGRVIAGFGLGWSKDEFQVSNVPFVNEGQRGDQFIQLLKSIWTSSDNNGDVVEFKGKYYNIPESSILIHKPLARDFDGILDLTIV